MSNTLPITTLPMIEVEIDDEIEFHVSYHEYYEKDLKPENNKYDKLLKDYYELKRESTEFRALNNSLFKELGDKNEIIKKLVEEKNEKFKKFEEKLEEKNEKIKNLENDYSILNKTKNDLTQQIDSLNVEVDQLKEINNSLKDENGELQNYIGKETTFSLNNDGDKNHTSGAQLVKDIINLQRMIENYIGNLILNLDINLEEVNKLLRSYKCQTQVKSKYNSPLLIKSVLQRYVISEIIKNAKYHLENKSRITRNSRITSSESDVFEITKDLLNSLDKLLKSRDGSHEVIKDYPIKIRQQINGFLGSLGFANIKSENKEHPIVSDIKDRLNDSMDKFFTIKDPKQREKYDDMATNLMATNLIPEVIRIFFFRLNVQEPVVKVRWFPYNTKIDHNSMKGRSENENDDNIDNSFVELCYFPLLSANNGQKIYGRAKVIQISNFNK